jgi:hypothetical protein
MVDVPCRDSILPGVMEDIERQKVLDAAAVAPLRDALLVPPDRVGAKPPAVILRSGPLAR